MKNLLLALIVLATAGIGFAKTDPTRPMVTGHGNVAVRPGKTLIANQTPAQAPFQLDRFVVTGSLVKVAAKPSPRRKH